MSRAKHLQASAVFMAFLIVMIPVCFADTINLQYDANGNLVTGDGLYRTHNSLNQLWKVYNGSAEIEANLLVEYVYHPVEERVLIKREYSGGQAVQNTSYISDEFVRVRNTSGTYDYTYVKHEGQRVVEIGPSGNEKYIHPDHLGSTSLITDAQGSAVETTHYTPYGLILSGGNTSRYSYEGQEYDSAIDQYDFHFRGYKSDWALFTQPDSLISNVYDPQSLNRYMFERGNPYKYRDESGHLTQLIIAISIVVIMTLALFYNDPGIVDIIYELVFGSYNDKKVAKESLKRPSEPYPEDTQKDGQTLSFEYGVSSLYKDNPYSNTIKKSPCNLIRSYNANSNIFEYQNRGFSQYLTGAGSNKYYVSSKSGRRYTYINKKGERFYAYRDSSGKLHLDKIKGGRRDSD